MWIVSLTEWQVWEPFVDALRRSAPPGTDVSEFAGTVGGGTWDGTYLDDGDAADRAGELADARPGRGRPAQRVDEGLPDLPLGETHDPHDACSCWACRLGVP